MDYLKYLPVNLATSHPQYDKEGNAYNFGTSVAAKGKTKYTLFKVPAVPEKGRLSNLTTPGHNFFTFNLVLYNAALRSDSGFSVKMYVYYCLPPLIMILPGSVRKCVGVCPDHH